MQERWYDAAQVCRNGHLINPLAVSFPETNATFCERCGAATLLTCPSCDAPIRGVYHLAGTVEAITYAVPAYCTSCGEPYPWTALRLVAAQLLVEEAAGLSVAERRVLQESICDLVRETPRARVALVRFKRLVAKAGRELTESLREILVDVLSEATKRALWG